MSDYLKCSHAVSEVVEVALAEGFTWGYQARVCVSCNLILSKV